MGEENEDATAEEILEALARLVERGEIVVRGGVTAEVRVSRAEVTVRA